MRSTITTTLAISISALAGLAGAQDLVHKAPAQDHPILLAGGTIHTITGETLEGGAVLFDGGRITQIMDAGTLEEWSGRSHIATIETIDVSGKHVYPGLIATGSNLGLTEVGAVSVTNDSNETGSFTPEVIAAQAVNPDSTHIPVARSNGVLISGLMPTGGTVTGRASVIHVDGWTWEDMTVEPTVGLVMSWPSLRVSRSPFVRMSEAEQMKRTKDTLDAIDDLFDRAGAYHRASESDTSIAMDVRFDAMRDTMSGDAPVWISANEIEQIQSAVSWAVGRGMRPVIVGGRDAWMCANFLNENNVPVVLTGTHSLPRRRDSAVDEPFAIPARLQEAGVRWCLTNRSSSSVRNMPYHLATAVPFGLDRDDAVRAMTIWPAQILGIDEDYGSLESGKSATLIVTDGDILDIRSNVERAFIDGRRLDLMDKQKSLRDKYREKYRQLGGS
ncbi:MAG: amidohydrolase family protein [Planctomycetota bacterium]|jgi:imidazolonepropionase-like amidohydrolase